VLVHDAAYKSVSKEGRADLHEQFADWLEQVPDLRPAEIDERMARHLKAAYKLREELGHAEPSVADLRRRAGEWLATAGLRAARRGDAPGTAGRLLRDAVELLPSRHPKRLEAQLHLADTLAETLLQASQKVDLDEVTDLYGTTIEAARAAGDRSIELHAALGRLEFAWFSDLKTLLEPGGLVEEATDQFEWDRDDLGLAKAARIRAYIRAAVGLSIDGRRAAEHAVRMAERAKHLRLEARSRQLRCFILDWGPTPVDEVAQHSGETLDWAKRQGIRSVERDVRNVLARNEAMRGDFAAARKQIELRQKTQRSTREALLWVADEMTDASVDLLEERPDAAEGTLRRTYSYLRAMQGQGPLAIVAAMLARVLLVQGRDDEAERLAEECARIAPGSQRDAQIKHREIRAVVLARRAASLALRGASDVAAPLAEAAERLAREAVALGEQSEQLDSRAEARYDLAEVLGRAGRWEEAEEELERARGLWLQKGNLVSARRAPKLLAELRRARPDP